MSAFEPRFTITNAITAGLTTIERARGFLQAATLSEEWVRRMSQRALLLEAHHTTHIEGTQLTLEQSERVWAGEHVAGVRPDDVRELLNYRDAISLDLSILSPMATDARPGAPRRSPRRSQLHGGGTKWVPPREAILRRRR